MKQISFFLLLIIAASCNIEEDTSQTAEENPPMPDFNMEGSDAEAVALADSIMVRMGGRKNWDNTRYLSWTFFGRRKLLWDKWNGDVRIEFVNNPSTVYLVNIHSLEGKVKKNGEEITHPDSLTKELKRAESIWINDSYWLCMPFKLKDSGVTLKYLREDTTLTGMMSDVLGLTFEGVGDTPQNKYELWVTHEDGLIMQWAYFRESSQDSASFIRAWDNYQKHGEILLSGNRSDGGGPADIEVLESVPENAFTSLDPLE